MFSYVKFLVLTAFGTESFEKVKDKIEKKQANLDNFLYIIQ